MGNHDVNDSNNISAAAANADPILRLPLAIGWACCEILGPEIGWGVACPLVAV